MPNASAAELLKEKLVKPGGRLEPETQTFEVARIYPPFDEEKGPNSQQDCEAGRGEDRGGAQVSLSKAPASQEVASGTYE